MKTAPTTSKTIELFKLLPYQSAFAANRSRFKIGLWARQTGKDHTATAEAVLDCFHRPGTTWIIVAASERQALESLAKAKEWAATLQFDIKEYNEAPGSIPLPGRTCAPHVPAGAPPAEPTIHQSPVPRLASAEIKWSNGSRLMALPANPATIRGYSANLILTEFAFHENPDAIWRAIYPAISNPFRGGPKKLRIISTPNGLTNRFAQLWHANHEGENPIFHTSKVTIHDAINAGLGIDADELKAALNDPEAWSQEYLCDFTDNSTVLLPYSLIESCESSFASELSTPQALSASAIPGGSSPQLIAGIDFARKNHLTVCWILERVNASALKSEFATTITSDPSLPAASPTHQPGKTRQFCYLTREVLCLQNRSTPEQIEILRSRLKLCRRIAVDYTGPGVGLGDFLLREFSSSRVELCAFTSAFKAELFPRLAAAFENRELQIPISRDIREDLHSIYRTTTNSGQILYRAQSTPGGHADRATALALALRAGQTMPAIHGAVSFQARHPDGRRLWSGRYDNTPEKRILLNIS